MQIAKPLFTSTLPPLSPHAFCGCPGQSTAQHAFSDLNDSVADSGCLSRIRIFSILDLKDSRIPDPHQHPIQDLKFLSQKPKTQKIEI
jgi:hypothetical protein